MRNIRNYFKKLALMLSICILCISCGERSGDYSAEDETKPLKVGVIYGVEYDLMITVAEVVQRDYKFTIDVVKFFHYSAVNQALADGTIDANVFQHVPYLDNDQARFDVKLVVVGYTFLYPMAAYSNKIHNINQLRYGATIAIPEDPINEKRALLLLEDKGLIKLGGQKNNLLDITYNPQNYEFELHDASQIYLSLADVDMAVINSNYAVSKGLIPTRDGLIIEDNDTAYKNVIVAREDNKNDPRIKDLVEAYSSSKVREKVKELFKNSVVF